MKKIGNIICGFPGTGKRHTIDRFGTLCKIVCVDNMEFKWIGSILSDFGLSYPKVFVNQIKKLQESYDFILLSSDREVRDILNAYNIPYHLVYPDISLKHEYIGRAYLNNYTDEYIMWLANKWDAIIKNCMIDKTPNKYVLTQNEFIGNYIMQLIAEDEKYDSEDKKDRLG